MGSIADEHFKKLGYEKSYLRDKKDIVVWGECWTNDMGTKISFDYIDNEICVAFENIAVYFGLDILSAINEKVLELGW